MWLKRRNDVTTDDLQYIECASFAKSEVQQSHAHFHRILNLDFMLMDGASVHGSTPAHGARALEYLLERIEHYDVVLVRDRHHPPRSPLFNWKPDPAHAQGGTWEVGTHHPMEYRALDRLRREARPLRGCASQSATEVTATLAAAAVTAGRVAVTENKRYPLIAALAYQYTGAEKNKLAALRCKFENEFTGPESRRSGEIKKTDPAYSGLNRRNMPQGNYRLEFQNANTALDACVIKVARSSTPHG